MKLVAIPEALRHRVGEPDGAPDCAWLLEHGQTWRTGLDPDGGVDRMVAVRRENGMRFPYARCFNNVRRLVEADPWFTYVEGVAQNTSTTAEWHAWAATPAGTVVDPTWHPDGVPQEHQTYYGAAFSPEGLAAHPEAFDPHVGMVAAMLGKRAGGTISLLVLDDADRRSIAESVRSPEDNDS